MTDNEIVTVSCEEATSVKFVEQNTKVVLEFECKNQRDRKSLYNKLSKAGRTGSLKLVFVLGKAR